MITGSKEDYSKPSWKLRAKARRHLGHAGPLAVSFTPSGHDGITRLKKDGLVRVRTDGQVGLTAAGRKIARRLTLRHHLIERMLTEMFGMEWYKVHDEAERLEHAVSQILKQTASEAGTWRSVSSR